MSGPVLGEIIMTGFDFAPKGYALCDGRELPIAQYQALYSLLGTTYGGNGQTTFALPDLRGRVPIAASDTITRGTKGGAESHVLRGEEMPVHDHPMLASSDAPNAFGPGNSLMAPNSVENGPQYITPGTDLVAMASQCIGQTGGGQAHNNVQPSFVINFCIALTGSLQPQDSSSNT